MDGEEMNRPTVDTRIPRRLGALGRAIRLRMVWLGLAWVAVAAVAAAAVSLGVDFGVCRLTLRHLTLLQRLFVNALCAAGVAAVAVRRLVLPLARARFGRDDLALVVEAAFPALQDRLISALQLSGSRRPAGGETSGDLVARVVSEANEAVRPLAFRSVLRTAAVRRASLWAAASLAAAAAFAATHRELVEPWFVRNVLLRDVPYPKRTRLTIAAKLPIRVVRGASLAVTVRADERKIVPRDVVFHMRFPSMGDLSETVRPAAGRGAAFVKVFPAVTEPFTFHVTGNDDRTPSAKVELVEPPALSDMRFVIHPPAYTRTEPFQVRRSQGTLEVPEDSEVTFAGEATKDLALAQLFLDDEPAGRCRAVKDGGSGAARRVEGELRVKAPVPFRPRFQLRLALTDSDGFQNPRAAAYSLVLARDQPPTVQLEDSGMGGLVSTRARIPLTLAGKDDYGVSDFELEWCVQSAPQSVRTVPVARYDPPQREPGPVAFVLDLEQAAALSSGAAPPLQVGETIRVQAAVTDSLPAAMGTNRVVSNILTFRIVTDDEVLSGLVDSQRAMRERLRQIVALQTEIRDLTQTAVEESGKDTTLSLAYRDAASCADSQTQVKDQLAGTVERLEVLLQRIRNNRIVAEGDVRRMQTGVIDPLRQARTDFVDPLLAGFLAARSVRGGEALAGALRELVVAQDALLRTLEAILAEMIKVESAQQVERGLRTIIQLSDRVREMVRGGTNAVPQTGDGARPGAGAGEGQP